MKCPVCREIILTMSERSGVEIDFCPQCRGVWLDRGELDKIIEKVHESTKPAVQPSPSFGQPTSDYNQHPHYKYKRKKSFLEELFD